jgi:D-galactarolactone cycloisomerase
MNRREMLGRCTALMTAGAGASIVSELLAPLKALAAEVKPVKIKNIEILTIEIPATPAEVKAGVSNRFSVTRVETESGVRGYSFTGAISSGAFAPSQGAAGRGTTPSAGTPAAGRGPGRGGGAVAVQQVREKLLGADLFAMEQHLKNGLMSAGGVEEALWDTIGRVAGQPVHRILGGAKTTSIPVYITYVWPGGADQSHIAPKEQGVQAGRIKNAGFKAMKIRIFRPNYMDDVAACNEMLAAGGPGFKVMVDRTAAASGKLWDYSTGLAAANALEKAGVYWLEEPFARDDYDGPARLARDMQKLLITGGEGFRGLEPYRECLLRRTFDILQPDLRGVGGLLTVRKVAILCEAFDVPVIQHGAEHGIPVAGRIQAAAAFGAPMVEFISVAPPLTLQEQWAPSLKILNQKEVFTFQNGEIQVPQGPGLGLDINEQALEHFLV